MKKIILLLSLSLLIIFVLYSKDSNKFPTIYFKMKLNDCSRCYNPPLSIANYFDKKLEGQINLIGSVLCDREIELKYFKENTLWNYEIIPDFGNMFDSLSCEGNYNMILVHNNETHCLNFSDDIESSIKNINQILFE